MKVVATRAMFAAVLPLLAVSAVLLHPSSDARSTPRTLDRTFVCTPLTFGGVRDLDAEVKPAHVDTFGRRFAPLIDVRSGGSLPESGLVFVRARLQPWAWGLSIPWPLKGQPGVYANSRRCNDASGSLPLSPRGFPGPPTRWAKRVDCVVSGRVLVRVRAELASVARWTRADRWYSGARALVRQAKVAVATQASKRPIAYMEIAGDGTVRLWSSRGCS
jgi:hypothetical protein